MQSARLSLVHSSRSKSPFTRRPLLFFYLEKYVSGYRSSVSVQNLPLTRLVCASVLWAHLTKAAKYHTHSHEEPRSPSTITSSIAYAHVSHADTIRTVASPTSGLNEARPVVIIALFYIAMAMPHRQRYTPSFPRMCMLVGLWI